MSGGEDIIKYEFRNHKFYFYRTLDAEDLIKEIFSDNYKVLESNIDFKPGDVILDIGACEGMFSIMMAGLYPETHIIALEPVPRTFAQLVRNVGLNACTNISCYSIGVGKPGQINGTLYVSKDHSGGSTSLCQYNPNHHIKQPVSLVSLDDLFTIHNIERCRLMKIDIEGAEYDVLYGSTVLPRIDHLALEVHHNRNLDYQSFRPDGLINWVGNRTKLLGVELCGMAE